MAIARAGRIRRRRARCSRSPTPPRPSRSPASAEGRRSATSPVPNTRDQPQISTYHSGGVFSRCTTERSVAPRLACSTCTGVYASSYQKLCRSSVLRRSAAASTTNAASGHHSGRACPAPRPARSPIAAGPPRGVPPQKLLAPPRATRPRAPPSSPRVSGSSGAPGGVGRPHRSSLHRRAEAGVAVDALVLEVRRQVEAAAAPRARPCTVGPVTIRHTCGCVPGGPDPVLPHSTSRVVWCVRSCSIGDVVVVVARDVRHVRRSAVRRSLTCTCAHHVVDDRHRQHQERQHQQRALHAAQVAAAAALVLARAQALGQALPAPVAARRSPRSRSTRALCRAAEFECVLARS